MVFALSIRVGLISIVCLSAGGALAALTWWFWKTAMPEPAALARLEIMSDRRYEEASPRERELLLAEANEVMPISIRNSKAPVAAQRPTAIRKPQKPVRVRQPQLQQEPHEPPTRRSIDPLLK